MPETWKKFADALVTAITALKELKRVQDLGRGEHSRVIAVTTYNNAMDNLVDAEPVGSPPPEYVKMRDQATSLINARRAEN